MVLALRNEGLTVRQIADRLAIPFGTAGFYLRDVAPPPVERLDRSILPPDIPRRHQNYYLLVAYERGQKIADQWTRELMADDA